MMRYSELDFLRGVAVLGMILFHGAFDLQYFYDVDIQTPAWLAKCIASIFLFVIGICFTISWERRKTQSFFSAYLYYVRRGIFIFSGGMIISFSTWIVAPDAFVKFGILHLIGISALIQPMFLPLRGWNLITGGIVLAFSFITNAMSSNIPYLFPIGIINTSFASLDYYPMVPWFGVVLLGMGAGSLLYVPNRSSWIMWMDRLRYPQWILWIGRKAFWIYFVHQPLLLGILFLGKGV